MSKIEMMNIKEIKVNKKNPRLIKDYKFKKMVKSIQDFEEMLKIRPIVIDENNIILGGNMRFQACKELGIKEIPIMRVENLSEEKKKEFIIKDNLDYGEWDFDILANEWDIEELENWGLYIIPNSDTNIDDLFSDDDKIEKKKEDKIIKCPNCGEGIEI